jgi:hypothetical protein
MLGGERVIVKPMKGDLVEAQGRDPRGELLGGDKAMRGSAIGNWVTPVRCERTFRMHQSLKPGKRRRHTFRCVTEAGENGTKGKRVERRGGYRKGEFSVGLKPKGVTGMK